MLQFLSDHIWLRAYQPFFVGMRVAGILMLVVGALLSLVQTDLRRLTAFFITAVNGVSLLTLGLASRNGIETFISLLPLNMIVWFISAVSAQMIADSHELSLSELRGLFRTRPYLCAAFVLAFLTAGGMPLLAGFPLHMTMLSDAFARSSALGWAASAGCSLMIFGGVRLALVFLYPGIEPDDPGLTAFGEKTKRAKLCARAFERESDSLFKLAVFLKDFERTGCGWERSEDGRFLNVSWHAFAKDGERYRAYQNNSDREFVRGDVRVPPHGFALVRVQ